MTKTYTLDSKSGKLVPGKETQTNPEVGKRIKTLPFVSRFKKFRGVIIRVPISVNEEEGRRPICLYDIYDYETDQLYMGVLSTEVTYDE